MDNGVDLDSVLTYGFAVDGVLTGTVVDLTVVVADNGDWLTVLLPGVVVGVRDCAWQVITTYKRSQSN